MREVRSRSLDIRLGEDYSQLLKFQYDINITAQRTPPTLEEDLTSAAEKSPAPAVHLETQDSNVQAPSSPPQARSPPSPTLPTSPPSPVSPASPASPPSPASSALASPPAQPDSQTAAGEAGQQQEVEVKTDSRDGTEVVMATSSSAMFVCASKAGYAR